MTTIQTIAVWVLAVLVGTPILIRLYRNLVTALNWPYDKDFIDSQEYTFGPDYPRGW